MVLSRLFCRGCLPAFLVSALLISPILAQNMAGSRPAATRTYNSSTGSQTGAIGQPAAGRPALRGRGPGWSAVHGEPARSSREAAVSGPVDRRKGGRGEVLSHP